MASLALVAVTYDHASIDLLERAALSDDRAAALADLLVALPGVDEAVVLSTCNRTELYLAGAHPHHADALDRLAAVTGADRDALAAAATKATDDAVALHLFRVASGLESRIVGEREILTQVRAAAARATSAGTAGRHLTALFRWAAATGRRVRRVDASPSASAPSLASIALDSVAPTSTTDAPVLVVGAGAMAAATTAELRVRRRAYLVTARRVERAARLARTGADVVAFDRWVDALADASVAVFATSAGGVLLSRAVAADVVGRRGGWPLTIVDLSMPRNVDPAVATLAGVRLVDLADLSADRGDLFERRAMQVVVDEHHRYRRWLAGQAAGHAIADMRAAIAAACRTSLVPALAGGCIPVDVADRLAARLAGRVAHEPTLALKELVARGDDAGAAALLAAFGVRGADAVSSGGDAAHLSVAS
ncbi:MAG TPA: glutamyl-tRNA reductase [Acidimicrobiales bacterium]|nr:glutamyl-tRNA reductase [Acidimicrobiales bacterium]